MNRYSTTLFVSSIVILSALLACSPAAPEASGTTEDSTPAETGAPEGVRMAREAALAHVQQNYGVPALTSRNDWVEKDITPPDMLGGSTFEFVSGNWMITVSYPVVSPEDTIYTVVLVNPVSNFNWVGRVDASGIVSDVDQTAEPAGSGAAPGERLASHEDARNAALAYVYNRYVPDPNGKTPPAEISWGRSEIPGSAGEYGVEFTSSDWIIRVRAQAAAPLPEDYTVEITSLVYGFQWAGTVDSLGHIAETRAPQPVEQPAPAAQGSLEVTGWFGHVESLPPGGQWDDKLVLANHAGEVGIEGENEGIQAEIVALRDRSEPGKYAHFWGTLTCGVPDFGSCQLLVSRLRQGTTFTEAEPVVAWQGMLINNPPGSQFDDHFVLSGDFPVAFGMHSLDQGLQAQLAELGQTGREFRAWGVLRTGVPDAFGSQIQVDRIEVLP